MKTKELFLETEQKISDYLKLTNLNQKTKTMILSTKKRNNCKPTANDMLLATVFSECKEGSIVAFKSKNTGEWYTGYIQSIFKPNGKYNKSDIWLISIYIYIPIQPQWYEDDDKTIYHYKDITNVMLLENGR